MKSIRFIGLFAVVLATIVVSFHAHRAADLTLPPPWNDESWSIYPAKNIALHGRLWAPELNPEKVIFCYPIQEALLAVTWPLHEGDLRTLRDAAWAFTVMSFLLTAAWIARAPGGWIGAAILSAFFLSAPMVVAGNIVRPEAPMLMLFALAMLFAERGSPYKALAIAAIAAALHPAGIIGLGLFALGCVAVIARERRMPAKTDCVVWSIPIVVWGYYVQLIARNWGDYREYLHATYSEPMTQSAASVLTSAWLLYVVAPAALVIVISWFVRRAWAMPAVALLGIALIPAIRTQMWYESYKSWSIALLCAMGVPLMAEILARLATRIPNPARFAIAAAACLPMLHFAYRHGWLEGPRGYPHDLTWGWGMVAVDPAVPFFTAEDEVSISSQLRALADSGRLMMRPDADSLLFRGGFEPLQIYQPVRATVSPDWVLFRRSRYVPAWVRDAHLAGITNGYRQIAILHARDGTEEWSLWARFREL